MTDLLFCYGILKRGHALDLTRLGGKFIQEDTIYGNLYSIGNGVGLILGTKEQDRGAHGEVFEIPSQLWRYLDEIENEPEYYKRVKVQTLKGLEVQVYEHNAYPAEVYGTKRFPRIESGWFE